MLIFTKALNIHQRMTFFLSPHVGSIIVEPPNNQGSHTMLNYQWIKKFKLLGNDVSVCILECLSGLHIILYFHIN